MARPKALMCGILLGILGISLVITGIVLIFESDKIINDKIDENIPIVPGSESFSNWEDPAGNVYMQFWIFDVLNANNITTFGAKPSVRQLGPYTYKELRPKENITFLKQNRLLSYVGPKGYVFVPEMSNGTEEDQFTGVNIPILTIATSLQYSSTIEQGLLRLALEYVGEGLFENYTVFQYLWGYELAAAKAINKWLNRTLIPPEDVTFGLFYGSDVGNMSNDGVYVIYTGKDDVSDVNEIHTWNNSSTLNYWNTPYCNMINGTDGAMWHPHVTKEDTLYIFSSDICRSIYLKYESDVTVKDINLFHFVAPASVFANHTINPDNEGFCTPNCLDTGVLNVSVCKPKFAPMVISSPHFFQAADRYIDAIDGMHPTAADCQTYINVEPNTGVGLDLQKKLQLNAFIKPLLGLSGTDHIHPDGLIFPVIWLNESGLIDDDSAKKFRSEVLGPISLLHILMYTSIGVGGFVLILAVITILYAVNNIKAKEGDIQRLLNTDSSDTS